MRPVEERVRRPLCVFAGIRKSDKKAKTLVWRGRCAAWVLLAILSVTAAEGQHSFGNHRELACRANAICDASEGHKLVQAHNVLARLRLLGLRGGGRKAHGKDRRKDGKDRRATKQAGGVKQQGFQSLLSEQQGEIGG